MPRQWEGKGEGKGEEEGKGEGEGEGEGEGKGEGKGDGKREGRGMGKGKTDAQRVKEQIADRENTLYGHFLLSQYTYTRIRKGSYGLSRLSRSA